MSESRYSVPEIQDATMKVIAEELVWLPGAMPSHLLLLAAVMPPPVNREAKWVFQAARCVYGERGNLHVLLLALAGALLRPEENWLGRGSVAGKYPHPNRDPGEMAVEAFNRISLAALKCGDAVFFEHWARCMNAVVQGIKGKAEPAKLSVMLAYVAAKRESWERYRSSEPERLPPGLEGHEEFMHWKPFWQEVVETLNRDGAEFSSKWSADEMRGSGAHSVEFWPVGFSEKMQAALNADEIKRSEEAQRVQVQRCLKELGLEYLSHLPV
jgi:hypothetical protein